MFNFDWFKAKGHIGARGSPMDSRPTGNWYSHPGGTDNTKLLLSSLCMESPLVSLMGERMGVVSWGMGKRFYCLELLVQDGNKKSGVFSSIIVKLLMNSVPIYLSHEERFHHNLWPSLGHSFCSLCLFLSLCSTSISISKPQWIVRNFKWQCWKRLKRVWGREEGTGY